MISDDVFGDDFSSDDSSKENSTKSGGYSQEVFSKKIRGRQRTFFFDLKESSNGKFIKVSELSRGGQRSTIMFDGEDVDAFIEALQEIKEKL